MAKGYVYSFTPGCFPQTSTLLAEPYVAPDECCSGPCRIRAEGVRLVYWAPDDVHTTNTTNTTLPTHTSSNITLAPRVPEKPYTLVEDGFTFTSPSVYVIYSSISASQSCVARFDSSVLRGSTHVVTRAYKPEALSTANCGPSAWQSGAWSAINYPQLYTPPTWPEINERFSACRSGQPEISYEFASHEIANPQLSFPPDVNQFDPTWSTCSGIYLGAQDPPRILTKGSGLGPVTAGADPRPRPKPAMAHTKDPQPAASVANPQAVETGNSIGFLLFPSFHRTVHGFVPEPTGVGEQNSVPTINSAVFITTLPDTTQPKGAQAADVPHWSQTNLTPEFHSTVAAIAPQAAAAASQTAPAAVEGGASTPVWSNFAHPVGPQSNSANGGNREPTSPGFVQPQPDPSGTSTDILSHPVPNVAGSQFSQPATVDQPRIFPPGSGNGQPGVPQVGEVPAPVIAQGQTNGQSAGAVAPAGDPLAVPALPSIAGSQVQLATNGGIVVGSATVRPGQATTLGGQQVSVASEGVVIDSRTYPYAAPAPVMATIPPAAPLQVGGQQIHRAPNGQDVVYGDSTIIAGAQATISGHVVSAGPSVVVDQTSYALPVAAPSQVAVAGQALHKAPDGGIVVGSTTILPGAEITIGGHKISAGISSVAVDRSTYALSTHSPTNAGPTVIVGGQSAQRAANGAVAYGGAQIEPGAKPTIIAGHTVSAGLNNVVVDGNTYALPTPVPAASSPLIVDGQSIRKGQGGGVVIGSSTVMPGSLTTVGAHIVSVDQENAVIDGTRYNLPSGAGSVLHTNVAQSNADNPVTLIDGAVISVGGQAAKVSGTIISVLPNQKGLLVGSQTIPMPSAPTVGHVLTAAGKAFTAVNGQIMVAGTTLSKGSVTMIDSTRVSLGDSGLVIGSSTIPLPTVGPQSATPAITTLGQTFSQVGASDVVFGHTTLSIGGPATTIGGTEISFGTSGLVVGSSTVAFPTAAPTLTTLGHTFVPVGGSAVAIDGKTFSSGQATTIDGSLISLGSSGLVIGHSTIPYSVPSTDGAVEAITSDGYTISRLDSSRVIIDGSTLTEGGLAETIHGTLISIGASAIDIGSQSIPFIETVKATTTTSGYGDFIISGLGGNAPAATPLPSNSVTASQASSGGSRARVEVWILSMALGFGTCIAASML